MTDCKQLAYEARQGSKEAFAQLYQAVYQDLYRFALYVLKNPEDAQDAVAETVADAYAEITKLRDSEAFKGWIFKILSNKCKRKLKEYTRKTEPLYEQEGSVRGDLDRDMQVREAFFSLSDEPCRSSEGIRVRRSALSYIKTTIPCAQGLTER